MTASNHIMAASKCCFGHLNKCYKFDCLKLTSGLLQNFILKTLGQLVTQMPVN